MSCTEQAFAVFAELLPDPPPCDTSEPDWPATYLTAYAPEQYVTSAAAATGCDIDELWERIAHSPQLRHEITVAGRGPGHLLRPLHARGRFDRRLLLENPHCPDGLIVQLMAMPSPVMHDAIARHPRCPPELLETQRTSEPDRSAA